MTLRLKDWKQRNTKTDAQCELLIVSQFLPTFKTSQVLISDFVSWSDPLSLFLSLAVKKGTCILPKVNTTRLINNRLCTVNLQEAVLSNIPRLETRHYLWGCRQEHKNTHHFHFYRHSVCFRKVHLGGKKITLYFLGRKINHHSSNGQEHDNKCTILKALSLVAVSFI